MSQIDELKQFKELLDNGVITEDEFGQKKKEILSRSVHQDQNINGLIQSVRRIPEKTGLQSSRSKIVAGLLGILFGTFGIHNFYLGYKSKAIIQLILTLIGVLTSVLVIGIFIIIATYMWGLVEGILILISSGNSRWHVDAEGNDLQD